MKSHIKSCENAKNKIKNPVPTALLKIYNDLQ